MMELEKQYGHKLEGVPIIVLSGIYKGETGIISKVNGEGENCISFTIDFGHKEADIPRQEQMTFMPFACLLESENGTIVTRSAEARNMSIKMMLMVS